MLPDHLVARLNAMSEQAREFAARLSDPVVASDHLEYTRINRELSGLNKTVGLYEVYQVAIHDLEEAKAVLADGASDEEMRELAQMQFDDAQATITAQTDAVTRSLVSEDPDDLRDAIIEIRAGAGGDEAALWAGDLFRMYELLATRKGLKIEILEGDGSEQGGFKEVKFCLRGKGAFGTMRFESGVHRVQRVPKTETQGRIHTSTGSVAVLPEAEDVDIQLNEADIRVDTMRAGGPGGQNVNKTSSAVRLTHGPSGVVVKCQADPSQHKNRATAMRLLKARIFEIEREKKARARSEARASQIGSGGRSEKIRTYNYKDQRVTDHRIKLTVHNLSEVLDGELDPIIEGLRQAEVVERLAEL